MKKINDLRVSDTISKIANKTDAASAYRVDMSSRARARVCVCVCVRERERENVCEHVHRTNVNEYVCL